MMGEGGVLGVYLTVCCWEKVGILFRRELETGYRCKVKQISFPLGFPNFSLLIFLCFICEKKNLAFRSSFTHFHKNIPQILFVKKVERHNKIKLLVQCLSYFPNFLFLGNMLYTLRFQNINDFTSFLCRFCVWLRRFFPFYVCVIIVNLHSKVLQAILFDKFSLKP